MIVSIILSLCATFVFSNAETVHTTKVFIQPIEPKMFNWTTLQLGDEYTYHASLLNAPDLPKWIQYLYSPKHRMGFLYGAPPKHQSDIEVEIIAMNSRTYDTSRRVLHFNIEDKIDPALYEIQLKIDNLNVEELFDSHTLNRLLEIFKHRLWKESYLDLYVTFLTSATALGARLPLRPNEGEGVVMKLGSQSPFSSELIELQEEVKPLWKLTHCPRDFKRTTVERNFRDKGFLLDWCSFKLVQLESTSGESGEYIDEDYPPPHFDREPLWVQPSKDEVPDRSYIGEFFFTIIIPMIVMLVLVLILSAILCFHHEGMKDETDDFFDSVFNICEDYFSSKRNAEETDAQILQYTAVARATSTLRSLSSQREFTPELNGTRSRTSSPQNMVRGTDMNGYARPTPPPYHGTINRANRMDI